MNGLAAFIMRGRPQAVLTIAALTLLSWVLSLSGLLAAAAIALPTLRKGGKEGATIISMVLPVIAVVGQLVMGDALEAAEYSAAMWIPTLVIALILRESGRLGLALLSAVALSMMMVIVVYGFSDDPSAIWINQLQLVMKPMLEQSAPGVDSAMVQKTMTFFSHYATGAIAAGSVLTVMCSLLLARWWQANLYNPGGFRLEFLELGLPSWIAFGVLGLVALATVTSGVIAEVAVNLALPFLMLYLMVGFAVLHSVCAATKSGRFWLTGIYIGLLFIAPLVMMIALVGYSDSWVHWRKRLLKA
jgi:hypothetical protein